MNKEVLKMAAPRLIRRVARTGLALVMLPGLSLAQQQADQEGSQAKPAPSTAEVMANTKNEEWRRPSPENLVLFEFASGTVVLEMAPAFSPKHQARVRDLVRAGFFDGGSVVRSQENYVVQWAAREPGEGDKPQEGKASSLEAEFERPGVGVPFLGIKSPDPYAPETGFAIGQPAARDPETGTLWLPHCYGVVGVGRGEGPDTGNGTHLYAVIGHSPRHLDRNMTVIGRVVSGMEHLSTLPRGTGNLGFYETDEEQAPLARAVVAADLPKSERPKIELLRTNSASFAALLAARAARSESFFVHQANGIDVCNVSIPTRADGRE